MNGSWFCFHCPYWRSAESRGRDPNRRVVPPLRVQASLSGGRPKRPVLDPFLEPVPGAVYALGSVESKLRQGLSHPKVSKRLAKSLTLIPAKATPQSPLALAFTPKSWVT